MDNKVILITGSRKGIGKYLAEYYLKRGHFVVGCSRGCADIDHKCYRHFLLDVFDEVKVGEMCSEVFRSFGQLDILINNAGIAAMNHTLLTPLSSVNNILNTNVAGTFLCIREAAKIMKKKGWGRVVNFSTVALPLKLEGEAIYAASKAAVEILTKITAKELAAFGITVNAIGPTPIETDLIRSVPEDKIKAIVKRQAIRRLGEFRDVSHVIDFFISPESDFITGQVVYLGGV